MSIAAPVVSKAVADAVAAAQHFLEPAYRERDSTGSIIGKIVAAKSDHSVSQADDESRRAVIKEACLLLTSIHDAVVADQKQHGNQRAYDSNLLSAVYNLLDLLILEGVYPALPPNVGSSQERRTKCFLYRKSDPAYSPPEDLGVIDAILNGTLGKIAAEMDTGIEPMQRHRVLNDLIAGNAWLAHSENVQLAETDFGRYLERLPLPTLYRALTTLLKSNPPEWFRSALSSALSLLPLRKDGVRHTIDFIASSHPSTTTAVKDANSTPSQGTLLPLEALQQMSRLLSSVPSTMSPEAYFTALAPQLLNLLDGVEGKEISRVAAFIISNGILGKRAIGAPGTIGWRLFAEPLLKTFDPPTIKAGRKRKASSDMSLLEKQLVSQADLTVTLKRLSAIVESRPNPGLTGRLLRPILLPLWDLSNHEKSPIANSEVSSVAIRLLEALFKLSGNATQLLLLADNLLWDGTAEWEYGPSSEGGIAIRERERRSSGSVNIIEALPHIDHRVSTLNTLLSSVDDTIVGSIFLALSKQWLLPGSEDDLQKLQVESDPMKSFTQAKLIQAILEKFQDKISKQPDQLLGLIEQILQQEHEAMKLDIKRQKGLQKATYSSLSNIVQHEPTSEDAQFANENDPDEMLSVAISLLNTLTTSAEFRLGKETGKIITRIQQILDELSQNTNSSFSRTLKPSVQSALSLIKSIGASSTTSSSGSQPNTDSTAQSVQQTLNDIANDLSSDLPPIRNSAQHALQALIKTVDLTFDIPTVALLVLHTIRTDQEEFVYLAAIKTLVDLAMRRDIRFTAKLAADTFQDAKEEAGVDGRLRMGEALNALVEAISTVQNKVPVVERENVVRGIAEVVIAVAGRRGQRKREAQERQQKQRLEMRKQREAERAWGGEIPELPDDEEEMDPMVTEKHRQDLVAIEKIVKGWEDTGYEEDIRIRTSALSTLGHLLEWCLDSCSPAIVQTATDISLSILSLEEGLDKAILRRAAVLIILSILKAMDAAHEAGSELAMGLEAGRWIDIVRVLHWVKETEEDELVRDHAETVIQSLEAWRVKRLLGTREDERTTGVPKMGLEGRLRGLAVNIEANAANTGAFKRIEEIA